jgi:hypothetical protein
MRRLWAGLGRRDYWEWWRCTAIASRQTDALFPEPESRATFKQAPHLPLRPQFDILPFLATQSSKYARCALALLDLLPIGSGG